MNCPTEDSTWCVWNAASQGNGIGHSFVSLWEGFTIPTVVVVFILVAAFSAVMGFVAVNVMSKKGCI